MANDFTGRLRNLAVASNDGNLRGPALQAADRIEALQAESARLREALNGIASQWKSDEMTREQWDVADFIGGFDECIKVARAALQQDKQDKEGE